MKTGQARPKTATPKAEMCTMCVYCVTMWFNYCWIQHTCCIHVIPCMRINAPHQQKKLTTNYEKSQVFHLLYSTYTMARPERTKQLPKKLQPLTNVQLEKLETKKAKRAKQQAIRRSAKARAPGAGKTYGDQEIHRKCLLSEWMCIKNLHYTSPT